MSLLVFLQAFLGEVGEAAPALLDLQRRRVGGVFVLHHNQMANSARQSGILRQRRRSGRLARIGPWPGPRRKADSYQAVPTGSDSGRPAHIKP